MSHPASFLRRRRPENAEERTGLLGRLEKSIRALHAQPRNRFSPPSSAFSRKSGALTGCHARWRCSTRARWRKVSVRGNPPGQGGRGAMTSSSSHGLRPGRPTGAPGKLRHAYAAAGRRLTVVLGGPTPRRSPARGRGWGTSMRWWRGKGSGRPPNCWATSGKGRQPRAVSRIRARPESTSARPGHGNLERAKARARRKTWPPPPSRAAASSTATSAPSS